MAFLRIVTPLYLLLLEHDLFRKPAASPDQVRAGLFGIMLQTRRIMTQ